MKQCGSKLSGRESDTAKFINFEQEERQACGYGCVYRGNENVCSGIVIGHERDRAAVFIRETENGSENAENKESPADTADSLKKLHIFVGIVLTVAVIMALVSVWTKERSVTLFYLADRVPVYFHVDALGRLFITLTSVIWLAAGVYAFQYMKHEGEEKRFFGFFLLLYGVLLSLESAGNLITFYFLY